MRVSASQPREESARARFAVLENRNFTLLWLGLIISNSGSWMQIVAQGWLVYKLTDSPFYLGLVGVSRAIPMIVLPPMGGVIADRLPRLKLLKVTQSMSFLLALPLGVLVSTHTVQIWHILALSFLSGAVNAFDQPTRQALLPDLVRREDLANAIALNSAAWQGSSTFGPTLAGLAVPVIGIAGAFYANAISFLAVVAALFMMRDVPERSAGAVNRGLFQDLADGLRYVGATRMVLILILLSTVTSVFGRSYSQLLPVFAGGVLHKGSSALGFMMAAPGAGTLLGAGAVAWMRDIRHKGPVLFLGMAAFSASLVLFAVNRMFLPALFLLFLSGAFSLVFSTMLTTMLQLEVPGAMRGRVMSLVTVTLQGFAPLGSLLVGSLAEAVGTPEAVAISAVVVGIGAVLAAIAAPDVRDFVSKLDQPDRAAPAPAS